MQTQQRQASDLLEAYLKAPSVALRNDLVLQYSYIPKTVAAQMRAQALTHQE